MADERWARVRKSMEPAWNDLREQRVLARVQEARRAQVAKSPRRFVWIAAAAAAIAVLGVGSKVLRDRERPSQMTSAPPASAPPKMMLADGSEAVLSSDAEVKLEEQRDDQVRLVQTTGEVRYEVKPNPKRRFAVSAGDVTIRVIGTAFTVTVASNTVTVKVHRGRVEVHDGNRVTELAADETLQVPAKRPLPEPVPSPSLAPAPPIEKKTPTVEALLQKADEARAAHKYDDAANALRAMIAAYPGDPRVASALFTLGRVERARGRHGAAAEAFARCHKAAPHGALAEDALAEEAISWKSAGDAARARAAAKKYLQLHPSGPHVARMMPLAE